MTYEEARKRDAADPLSFARERFCLPEGVIYLDGNSLGAYPADASRALLETAQKQWGNDLIASWNKHGWIDWPKRIAARLAPIVGAKTDELLIADSTSVSLFKLLGAAISARPDRKTIIVEKHNFPTDLYVSQGLARLFGLRLKSIEPDNLIKAIDADTAAITLSHVDYRSASIRDMEAINQAADRAGALVVWDLSHSAGAVELDLNGSGSKLAIGCGYKYLNGGPGAPAFLYVAARPGQALHSPIPGWMGHADPFAFESEYRPAEGIDRFLTGTPPILALAALEVGLATFDGIAMRDIAAKSRSLSQLFIEEVKRRCGDTLLLQSPHEAAERGSHVVLAHSQGYAVMQALIARGVIGDFRAPDLMRFGFAPLYNSHFEMVRAAEILAGILETREWDQPRFKVRGKVT